jgi:hypothetical protein
MEMNWYGLVQLGKEEKLEAISQPETFILTCKFCGTSARIKDDFSCPACGAPFDMRFTASLPMMVHTMQPGLMSKKEARQRWLNIDGEPWHSK